MTSSYLLLITQVTFLYWTLFRDKVLSDNVFTLCWRKLIIFVGFLFLDKEFFALYIIINCYMIIHLKVLEVKEIQPKCQTTITFQISSTPFITQSIIHSIHHSLNSPPTTFAHTPSHKFFLNQLKWPTT